MHIGVLTVVTDQSLDAATMAKMVEEAGFESFFVGEHSHIPASRETPYPGGGGLPAGYERTMDLFVALTHAAVATTSLRIGTGICQMVQRDPILTAKAVASVDRLSDGRIVFITGSSWNLEEMRNHGVDPETRYELLDERVRAMREIWTHDEATFHGRFVDFDRIWSWPKPHQRPMPTLIGGNSSGVEDRALRIGTGWAPLHVPGVPKRVKAYLARAAEEGIETSVTAVGGDLSPELIESYAAAGADRWIHAVLTLDAEGRPTTAPPTREGELARQLEELGAVHADFAGTP